MPPGHVLVAATPLPDAFRTPVTACGKIRETRQDFEHGTVYLVQVENRYDPPDVADKKGSRIVVAQRMACDGLALQYVREA